ncbi:MAG: ArnT family glycosyltransferase [Dehalococcoidia bacterium]
MIEEGGRRWQLQRLPFFLPAAKLPIALLTAVGVVGIYLLTKALFSGRIAFLSAILIAIDPLYLAHSRVLHLDALTTTFMTLSLLSFLAYLTRRRSAAYLFLSGGTAGLAFLTKSPSLYLIPFVGLLFATCCIRSRSLRKVVSQWLLPFALWGTIAALVFFALWPAMWVDPLGSLQGVLASAIRSAGTPHENLNFFLGQVRPDPGPWFYPFALLFRITPLAMLGVVASIPLLFRGKREQRMALMSLLTYILLFSGFMSMGAKKFDCYLLPIFPLVDIMAAAGLWATVEAMGFKWGDRWRRWAIVGLALATILQAGKEPPWETGSFWSRG